MTDTQETTTEMVYKGSSKIGRGVSIRFIGAVTIIVAIALAFFAFGAAGYISDARDSAEDSESRYLECSDAVVSLKEASDYLTMQARLFVTSGRWECLSAYVDEITVANRRGQAIVSLEENLNGDEAATDLLQQALAASDELAAREMLAMRLAADYYEIDNLPSMLADVELTPAQQAMSSERKLEQATFLVFSADYSAAQDEIAANVEASSEALLANLNEDMEASDASMRNLLFGLRISVALLLCVVMFLVLVMLMNVLTPLSRYIKRIKAGEALDPAGSYELRYLADAYNAMYEDNIKRIQQLRELSERDPLTGISNRAGYDSFLAKHTRNVALLLINIDNFKDFNAVYGRDTGDAVLVKLGQALSTAFRSTDFPCRIHGDLFAVIMTNMNDDLREAVSSKVDLVNSILADDSDDLPLITLSVGAAFSTEGMDDDDIYRAANDALAAAQEKGNNLTFYGEGN